MQGDSEHVGAAYHSYSKDVPHTLALQTAPSTPVNFKIMDASLDKLWIRPGQEVPYFVEFCLEIIERYGLKTQGLYTSSINYLQLQALERILQEVDWSEKGTLCYVDRTMTTLIVNLDCEDMTEYLEYFEHSALDVSVLLREFIRTLHEPLIIKEQQFRLDLRNAIAQGRSDTKIVIRKLPDIHDLTLTRLLSHLATMAWRNSFVYVNIWVLGSHMAYAIFGEPHCMKQCSPQKEARRGDWKVFYVQDDLQERIWSY